MPSRAGRRADPYGVQGWDDGYEYIQADANSPLGGPTDRYFPSPSSTPSRPKQPPRSSRYDTADTLPRPPVGRDRERERDRDYNNNNNNNNNPSLRPRDSAELLRDSHTRAPPRRRQRSPSPPRPFQPQRDRSYRPPSPPYTSGLGSGSSSGAGAGAARRYQRSPSPPPRRRADRPTRDRHPPRAAYGRPPLGGYDDYSTSPYGAGKGGPTPASSGRDYPPSAAQRRYSFDAGPDRARDHVRRTGRTSRSPSPTGRYGARRSTALSRSPSPVGRRPGLRRSNTTGAAAVAGAAKAKGGVTRTMSGRWGKVAVSALQAGGMTAYNLRDDPGAWAGPKGARVGMAVLGAAALDAFRAGGNKPAAKSSGGGGGRGSNGGGAFGSALGEFLLDGIAKQAKKR